MRHPLIMYVTFMHTDPPTLTLPCALCAPRHAQPYILHQAVKDALTCTHVHTLGVDGAFAQALAVAWLARQGDDVTGASSASDGPANGRHEGHGNVGAGGGPGALLAHVAGVARTKEMKEKIGMVHERLKQVWGEGRLEASDPVCHALLIVCPVAFVLFTCPGQLVPTAAVVARQPLDLH